MKPVDASDRAAAPRKRKDRNLTANVMREFRQNGSQTCELCEGTIAAGNSVWGNSARYMRQHLDRCELATQADREHFKANGQWPAVKRKRT